MYHPTTKLNKNLHESRQYTFAVVCLGGWVRRAANLLDMSGRRNAIGIDEIRANEPPDQSAGRQRNLSSRCAQCFRSGAGGDADRQGQDGARALSSHSLCFGLTQDLFAVGKDGVGIAQALRWSSTSTALRYEKKLAARSNVVARVLSHIRS